MRLPDILADFAPEHIKTRGRSQHARWVVPGEDGTNIVVITGKGGEKQSSVITVFRTTDTKKYSLSAKRDLPASPVSRAPLQDKRVLRDTPAGPFDRAVRNETFRQRGQGDSNNKIAIERNAVNRQSLMERIRRHVGDNNMHWDPEHMFAKETPETYPEVPPLSREAGEAEAGNADALPGLFETDPQTGLLPEETLARREALEGRAKPEAAKALDEALAAEDLRQRMEKSGYALMDSIFGESE